MRDHVIQTDFRPHPEISVKEMLLVLVEIQQKHPVVGANHFLSAEMEREILPLWERKRHVLDGLADAPNDGAPGCGIIGSHSEICVYLHSQIQDTGYLGLD
jgi:hypothetical protein